MSRYWGRGVYVYSQGT